MFSKSHTCFPKVIHHALCFCNVIIHLQCMYDMWCVAVTMDSQGMEALMNLKSLLDQEMMSREEYLEAVGLAKEAAKARCMAGIAELQAAQARAEAEASSFRGPGPPVQAQAVEHPQVRSSVHQIACIHVCNVGAATGECSIHAAAAWCGQFTAAGARDSGAANSCNCNKT